MDNNCSSRNQPTELDADTEDFGHYEPGFIHLRVNTRDDLSDLGQLLKLTDLPSWTPTFLHEYVHFLQATTTTNGLLHFLQAVQHLQNANKKVLGSSSATFAIPLSIDNDFNWHTNRQLIEIYRGREKPDSLPVKSIDYLGWTKVVEVIIDNNNTPIAVEKFGVDYFDKGAQTKMSVPFGSIHLKEYMAHAIQNQLVPGTAHDDLPYLLVELIVKMEVPRLAQDTSFVVAICDASLMDLHPARLFFRTLERMKSTPRWTPADANSVYDFAFENIMFSDGKKDDTIESLFIAKSHAATREFRDSLQAEIFKGNVLWFEEIIAEARKLRLNHRGFFSQLVASPGKLSNKFGEIYKALGIPFTTNRASKGYFVPPEKLKGAAIQPYYPKVFQAITKTYGGQLACSLHSYCEAEPQQTITNNDCLSKPWARVSRPKLCPYAQMWKMWGLKGKTPVKSNCP